MPRTHRRIADVDFIKYHPENDDLSIAEKRKEYARLRKIANARLKNFEGTPYTSTQTYIKNAGKFIPQSQISDRDIKYMLYDVAKFVDAKTSSVSGMRDIERRTIETAHERGMTWLNKGNLRDFGRYMDFLRAKYGAKNFDSERAQEVYGVATKKGLNSDEILKDFTFWKANLEELENLPKFRNPEKRTSENYKERLMKARR